MHLIYLSEARIPSRSTNSIQTMRMCAAFAHAGADLTLVHVDRDGPIPEGYTGDVGSFYGVNGSFDRRTLTRVPAVTARSTGLSRGARSVRFGAYMLSRSRPGQEPFACYSRSFLAASTAVLARRAVGRRSACRSIAIEVHDEPPTHSGWQLLRRVDKVFAISEALRARILERDPELAGRIEVEHDGVDIGAVTPSLLDRKAARTPLGIPVDVPVVVYTGRVNRRKGVDILLEAGAQLESAGARLLVVGKVYEPAFQAAATPNVTFAGFVPPVEVPNYLAAADILVLPSTAELPYSAYTSPLKLFEYMASGRPVVASDLPVLSEVLEHERNALIYPAKDATALAGTVERLIGDRELGAALAERAWNDVQSYAWDRRATRILREMSCLDSE